MKKLTVSRVSMRLFVALLSVFCLYSMALSLIVSFTNEDAIKKNGDSMMPVKLSLYAYRLIFTGGSSVLHLYAITVFVTVVWTGFAVLMTALAAYTLVNKSVKYRNCLVMYFFITMIFGSGLVPWYAGRHGRNEQT